MLNANDGRLEDFNELKLKVKEFDWERELEEYRQKAVLKNYNEGYSKACREPILTDDQAKTFFHLGLLFTFYSMTFLVSIIAEDSLYWASTIITLWITHSFFIGYGLLPVLFQGLVVEKLNYEDFESYVLSHREHLYFLKSQVDRSLQEFESQEVSSMQLFAKEKTQLQLDEIKAKLELSYNSSTTLEMPGKQHEN